MSAIGVVLGVGFSVLFGVLAFKGIGLKIGPGRHPEGFIFLTWFAFIMSLWGTGVLVRDAIQDWKRSRR